MTLTLEQQSALDELMRRVAEVKDPRGRPTPSLLETWLGVSPSDLKAAVGGLPAARDAGEARLLDWIESNPLDATVEFLAGAAWAFYWAERDANPRIKTYVDALYYITTCASVGYADLFAVTQTGRAIASLVMTVGPALTGKTLDRPRTMG
jgi:hypothetical protein